MAFRTNYKDEIATKIYQIVDAVGNAIIHEKVRLNPNYKPTQAGDKFGAAEVNAIHKRLNDLDDGTVKAKKATIADNATNASHATSADSTPLAGRAYTADDAKLIEGLSLKSTMLVGKGASGRVCSDALGNWDGQWYGCLGGGTTANMPRGVGVGLKRSIQYDDNWVFTIFFDVETNQIFTNSWYKPRGWSGWHDYHNAGYAINAGNANTVGGYKVGHSGNVVNAGGGNTIRIPYPSWVNKFEMACPYNANMDANYSYVESWASRTNYLEIRLKDANSNNLQINTFWLYK